MTTLATNPNAVAVGFTGAPIHEVIDSATNQKRFAAAFGLRTTADTITAHAGGTQAAGLLLTAEINIVTTVASIADSVLLPVSAPGMVVYVENAAANSMQVFGSGTDTINAVATATGVAQAGGKSAIYFCATAGAWFRVLSA